MEHSDALKVMEGTSPKVVAFSPLEAAITKPRSSPLTIESSKVKRSEIATLVTFYMIPSLLVSSKNGLATSILVGAVFHQIYMFHKEIFLDYVHHDITRKWALIYFKLLLLIMAKETIVYFNFIWVLSLAEGQSMYSSIHQKKWRWWIKFWRLVLFMDIFNIFPSQLHLYMHLKEDD